ncbi:hypothetical protein vseg_010700 [Gypsophila vaccaria]
MSMQDKPKSLTMNVTSKKQAMNQNQAETKDSISNIEKQMDQISSSIGRIEAKDTGKLPSTTVKNSNVSAMTLRSGKDLRKEEVAKRKDKERIAVEDKVEVPVKPNIPPMIRDSPEGTPPMPTIVPPPPFPSALKHTRRYKKDSNILEVFKKCEVNITLLELLKGVPKYDIFLKQFSTIK